MSIARMLSELLSVWLVASLVVGLIWIAVWRKHP